MEPTFIIDQMERLRAQAECETDPVLKKEHQKTLRHLHKQIRRATTLRSAWFGFLRIAGALCGLFLLTLWGVAKVTKTYGVGGAFEAGAITVIAFVIITATMLVSLKAVSPEIYSSVVAEALSAIKSLKGESDAVEKLSPGKKMKPELAAHSMPADESRNVPQVSFDVHAASADPPKPAPTIEQ